MARGGRRDHEMFSQCDVLVLDITLRTNTLILCNNDEAFVVLILCSCVYLTCVLTSVSTRSALADRANRSLHANIYKVTKIMVVQINEML